MGGAVKKPFVRGHSLIVRNFVQLLGPLRGLMFSIIALQISENTCSTNYFYISDSDNPERSLFWTGSASLRSSGFAHLWQYTKAHLRLDPWKPVEFYVDVRDIYGKEPAVTQCRALPWSDTQDPVATTNKPQGKPSQSSGPLQKSVETASLSSENSSKCKTEPLETRTDTNETDDKDFDREAKDNSEGGINDDFLSFLERAVGIYERSKSGCHESPLTRGTLMPTSTSPSEISTATATSSGSQVHNPAKGDCAKGMRTGADEPQRSTEGEALSAVQSTSIVPPITCSQ